MPANVTPINSRRARTAAAADPFANHRERRPAGAQLADDDSIPF